MIKTRRKAKACGVFIEDVNPLDVYERDGWCCQLCGGLISLAIHPRHDWSATVDHVIPLALGGSHKMANCQAAHYRCNVLKGVRVLAAD